MTIHKNKNLIMFCLMAVVIFIFCGLFLKTQIVFADENFDGLGTAVSPYILTENNLLKFKQYVEVDNQRFTYFYINSEVLTLPSGFTTIEKPFNGVLLGNGCEIKNATAPSIFKTIGLGSRVVNLIVTQTYNASSEIFGICEVNAGVISQIKINTNIGEFNTTKLAAAVCKDNLGLISDITVNGKVEGSSVAGICLNNFSRIDKVVFDGALKGINASGISTNGNDTNLNVSISNASVSGEIVAATVGGVSDKNFGQITKAQVSSRITTFNPSNAPNIGLNEKFESVGGIARDNFGEVSFSRFFGNSIFGKSVGGIALTNSVGGQIFSCSLILDRAFSIVGERVGGIVRLNEGRVYKVLVNASIAGNFSVGGVCETNRGTIDKAEVVADKDNALKIVGLAAGGIVSSNEGNIFGSNFKSAVIGAIVGGISATNSVGSEVSRCLSEGTVLSNNQVDFVGSLSDSEKIDIELDFNKLKQVGCGGISALNFGAIKDSVNNSIVSIKVDNNNPNKLSANLGGIAGINFNEISTCENNSAVVGNAINVGGIVGLNLGKVDNCAVAPYFKLVDKTPNVFGSFFVGGVVGFNGSGVNLTIDEGATIGDLEVSSGFKFKLINSTDIKASITNCFYQSTNADKSLRNIETSTNIDIDGGAFVGGVCGYLQNGSLGCNVVYGVVGSKQESKLGKYSFLGGCKKDAKQVSVYAGYYVRYAGAVQFYIDKIYDKEDISFINNFWSKDSDSLFDKIQESFEKLDFNLIWQQNSDGFLSLINRPNFTNHIELTLRCESPRLTESVNLDQLGGLKNPIKIYSGEDFKNCDGSLNYKLMNNIVLSESINTLSGQLDGNGFIISFNSGAVIKKSVGTIINLGLAGEKLVEENFGAIEFCFVNGGRLVDAYDGGIVKSSYGAINGSGNIYTSAGEKIVCSDMTNDLNYKTFNMSTVWFRPKDFNNGNLILRLNNKDNIFNVEINIEGGVLDYNGKTSDYAIIEVYKNDDITLNYQVDSSFDEKAQTVNNDFAKNTSIINGDIVLSDIFCDGSLDIYFNAKKGELGSKLNPISISKAVDLKKLEEYPNSCFKLVNNIMFKTNTDIVFKPILVFNGELDGKGYSIDGFKRLNADNFIMTLGKTGKLSNLGFTNGNNLVETNLGKIENCFCLDGLLAKTNEGSISRSYDFSASGRVFGDILKDNLSVRQINESVVWDNFQKTFSINNGLPILKNARQKVFQVNFETDDGAIILGEKTFEVLNGDDFCWEKDILSIKEGFKFSLFEAEPYKVIEDGDYFLSMVGCNVTIKIVTEKVTTNWSLILSLIGAAIVLAPVVITVAVSISKKKKQ